MSEDLTDVRRAIDIIETWNIRKVDRDIVPSGSDMRDFVELMNAQTRLLLAEYPTSCRHTAYWQDLARAAESASTYTSPGQTVNDVLWRARAIRLVNLFGRQEWEFYTGLMELAINAATLVTPGAKIIANKIDRTNL